MSFENNATCTALLLEMLTFKRPAGSKTERAFIAKYIKPTGAQPDHYGNYWLDVGPDAPVTLFSSHTDTVHHSEGMQKIEVHLGMARPVIERVKRKDLPTEKSTNCLGADCTTGVWLMLKMIEAGVPGRYAFFREEEIGGKGSDHVMRNEPWRLDGIKHAIAFDRKGYRDIITEQFGGRCCSDTFARSLADMLDLGMKPDPTGSFTDTANLIHLVPECTNISVGYFNQHGPKEEQDLEFAAVLLSRLITADWSTLVVERDHKAKASMWDAYGDYDHASGMEYFVQDHPGPIAEMLLNMGFDLESLKEEVGYYL
jgi:hypothetical protein